MPLAVCGGNVSAEAEQLHSVACSQFVQPLQHRAGETEVFVGVRLLLPLRSVVRRFPRIACTSFSFYAKHEFFSIPTRHCARASATAFTNTS